MSSSYSTVFGSRSIQKYCAFVSNNFYDFKTSSGSTTKDVVSPLLVLLQVDGSLNHFSCASFKVEKKWFSLVYVVQFGLCGSVWSMWFSLFYVVQFGLCGSVWSMWFSLVYVVQLLPTIHKLNGIHSTSAHCCKSWVQKKDVNYDNLINPVK